MREIKFRAWLKKEERWINVSSIEFAPKLLVRERIGYEDMVFFVGADCELMQFIGLKDKNNKDIYEGDIFKKGYYDKDKPILYIVEWREKDASYGWKQIVPVLTESFEMKDVEVIGNIYENSELK